MRQNILAQYQWDLSFFVFSPKNIGQGRKAIFHLVNWGFSYEALVTMPIEEFLDYSKLLYENKRTVSEKEANAISENRTQQKNPDGKSIGQISNNPLNN